LGANTFNTYLLHAFVVYSISVLGKFEIFSRLNYAAQLLTLLTVSAVTTFVLSLNVTSRIMKYLLNPPALKRKIDAK
jgi:fucose 4-O-acetylase-like acetyltransferase